MQSTVKKTDQRIWYIKHNIDSILRQDKEQEWEKENAKINYVYKQKI